MDALEAIMSRRSVRQFLPEPVSEELLEKILKAAMRAPSANNQQPWWYLVVRDRSRLEAITKFHPYAQMCRQAPLVVFVCGDPNLEKSPGYWIQDCSAATENLLLAAHALGLGAVWCGMYPREERVTKARELFGIPDHVIPLALVVMGYPAKKIDAQDTYKKERVFLDRWGSRP